MSAQTEKLLKGCAKIASLLVIVCVIFALYITLRSGIIPGLNPYIDSRRKELVNNVVKENTLSGEIFDSLGNQITKAEEVGKPAKLLFEECYSHLINYNSNGLYKKYYNELRIDKKDHVGADIQLTTVNDLQEYCYNQLEGKEGSLIVLNSKTGAILACASRSSKSQSYNTTVKESVFANIENFYINRATMAEDTLGSLIKIITAASMIENNMKNYVCDDSDGKVEINGNFIHNHGNKGNSKETDMELALKKSSNVYFALASLELGADNYKKTAEKFLLGKEIELDFTTLKSTFDLGVPGDKWALSQAAFGQGSVAASPLHGTFFMSAVINEGKIMKPYMVQNITNNNDTVYEAKEELLSKAIEKSTAKTLKDMLHKNAVHYGFDEDTYGKNVYAKTGTAQMDATKERFHIYYLVGVETESGEYVILVSERNTSNGSSNLKSIAKNVVDYVIAM